VEGKGEWEKNRKGSEGSCMKDVIKDGENLKKDCQPQSGN
jgi:hypothetical protein